MRSFEDTAISRAANARSHVAEYSAKAFDCALGGPFAKQFLTRLSAPRALCVVLNGFISASTVYDAKVYHRYTNLSIVFLIFADFFMPRVYFFKKRISLSYNSDLPKKR